MGGPVGSVRLVAVSQVEELPDGDSVVQTAFHKRPVSGGVHVGPLGLEGDRQADLTVHGGPDQAVYAYPFEHYAPWVRELGRTVVPPAFGENIVTDGILEDRIHIGDRLRIGSARFEVTQPRMPCRKLSLVHGDRLMTRTFAQRPRPGFYLRVLAAGRLDVGDVIEVERGGSAISVLDIFQLQTGAAWDEDLARQALELPALGTNTRRGLARRLGQGR